MKETGGPVQSKIFNPTFISILPPHLVVQNKLIRSRIEKLVFCFLFYLDAVKEDSILEIEVVLCFLFSLCASKREDL